MRDDLGVNLHKNYAFVLVHFRKYFVFSPIEHNNVFIMYVTTN
jgi:hypothetical protein